MKLTVCSISCGQTYSFVPRLQVQDKIGTNWLNSQSCTVTKPSLNDLTSSAPAVLWLGQGVSACLFSVILVRNAWWESTYYTNWCSSLDLPSTVGCRKTIGLLWVWGFVVYRWACWNLKLWNKVFLFHLHFTSNC